MDFDDMVKPAKAMFKALTDRIEVLEGRSQIVDAENRLKVLEERLDTLIRVRLDHLTARLGALETADPGGLLK